MASAPNLLYNNLFFVDAKLAAYVYPENQLVYVSGSVHPSPIPIPLNFIPVVLEFVITL